MMLPPRAYVFISLNVVRIMSIIALLLVFSSSIFVMVTDIRAVNHFLSVGHSGDATDDDLLNCDYIEGSTVPNQPAGVFWAVLNRLLVIFQVVILLLSEIGWPAKFFQRFFPVLGPSFGLGALGLFQCLIGATILSHHTDDFTLVSAFLLFSVGCLNAVLGLVFRESAKTKRSIMNWREEAKGMLPFDKRPVFTSPAASFVSSMFNGEKANEADSGLGTGNNNGNKATSFGFGRQGERTAGLKGFLISKPVESLPRYAPRPASTASSTTTTPSRPNTPVFKSSTIAI